MTYIEIGLQEIDGKWEAWDWDHTAKVEGESKAEALRNLAEEFEE